MHHRLAPGSSMSMRNRRPSMPVQSPSGDGPSRASHVMGEKLNDRANAELVVQRTPASANRHLAAIAERWQTPRLIPTYPGSIRDVSRQRSDADKLLRAVVTQFITALFGMSNENAGGWWFTLNPENHPRRPTCGRIEGCHSRNARSAERFSIWALATWPLGMQMPPKNR